MGEFNLETADICEGCELPYEEFWVCGVDNCGGTLYVGEGCGVGCFGLGP